MVQEIEMTEKEQLDMYMKCSKKELCKMLIEANRHLKKLPIHVVMSDACNFYISGNDTNGNCNNCGKPQYLHN